MTANLESPRSISTKLNSAQASGIYYNAGYDVQSQLAGLFGVEFDDAGSVVNGLQNSVQLNVAGISGICTEIGVRQNFDCVRFTIAPFDDTRLPSHVRVRILSGSSSGTVLADVIIPFLGAKAGVNTQITAELGTLIENSGGAELFLAVISDGSIGYVQSSQAPTVETGGAYYRTDANLANTSFSVQAAGRNEIYAETFACGSRNAYTAGIYNNAVRSPAGNFSGWGNFLVTTPTGPFNLVQLWINAYNAALLPTQVRLRFRNGGHTGAILATATAYVNLFSTGRYLANIYFDADVDLSSYANGTVWVEYLTDGVVGLTFSATSAAGNADRYAAGPAGINATLDFADAGAAGRTPWIRCIQQSRNARFRFDAGKLARSLVQQAPTPAATVSLDLLMPPAIYGVAGFETNVYFDGLCHANTDYHDFEHFLTYGVSVRGALLTDRWRQTVTGAMAGNGALTWNSYYQGQVANTKSTVTKFKALTAGVGVTRKMLLIGDSICARNSARVSATVRTNVAANTTPSAYALTSVGRLENGTGNFHEAVSGRRIDADATSGVSGINSPFWNGSAFSFSHYMTTNSLSMSSGDSVFILLGTNDMFGHETDTAAQTQLTTSAAALAAIIASIHAYNSGIKVWIGTIPQPAYEQEQWGRLYRPDRPRWRTVRNYNMWRRHILNTYSASESSNIYICPVHLCLDTIWNYPTTTEAVNARNATTQTILNPADGPLHPATSGQDQIADCVYSCLMSLES